MPRRVTRQEKIGPHDVLDLRNTARGDVLADTFQYIVGHVSQNRGHGRARRHTISGNRAVTNLQREAACEGENRAFRRGVVRETWRADVRELLSRIDNAAAILRIHHLQRRTRAEKCAAKVNAHEAIEICDLERRDGTGMSDPCVIHEDIQWA